MTNKDIETLRKNAIRIYLAKREVPATESLVNKIDKKTKKHFKL
jgi:hypothetical protein